MWYIRQAITIALLVNAYQMHAEVPPPRIATTAPGPYALLLRTHADREVPAEIDIAGYGVTLNGSGAWQCVHLPRHIHPSDWAIPTGIISQARIVAGSDKMAIALQTASDGGTMPLPFRTAEAFSARSDSDAVLSLHESQAEMFYEIPKHGSTTLRPPPLSPDAADYRVKAVSTSGAAGVLTLSPLYRSLNCVPHQGGVYFFEHYDDMGSPTHSLLAFFRSRADASPMNVPQGYIGAFHRFLPPGESVQGMLAISEIMTLEGFHARERQHHGPAPFKSWTAQSEAGIRFPVAEGLGVELRVGMIASPEGVPEQGAVLRHEDTNIPFGADGIATLWLPPETCAGKLFARVVVHARTWQPSVVLKSADTRQLGVMINDITLRYAKER